MGRRRPFLEPMQGEVPRVGGEHVQAADARLARVADDRPHEHVPEAPALDGLVHREGAELAQPIAVVTQGGDAAHGAVQLGDPERPDLLRDLFRRPREEDAASRVPLVDPADGLDVGEPRATVERRPGGERRDDVLRAVRRRVSLGDRAVRRLGAIGLVRAVRATAEVAANRGQPAEQRCLVGILEWAAHRGLRPHGQPPDRDEAHCGLVVEAVIGSVAGQAKVVERVRRSPADHGCGPWGEAQPHLPGDVALGPRHERAQGTRRAR